MGNCCRKKIITDDITEEVKSQLEPDFDYNVP